MNKSFNLPITILRPFNTYGPRQSNRAVIPTIITQLNRGYESIKLGALHPTRDLNFVKDITGGFFAALCSNNGLGEVINLGTNYEISINDLAKLIADLMDINLKIQIEEQRYRPKKSEVERLCADNTKAKKILDWSPEFIGKEGLTKGLRETINWFSNPENLINYKVGQYTL